MFIYKSIATFLGIGYIQKGAGTIASLVFCFVVFLFLQRPFSEGDGRFLLFMILALLPVGARVAYVLEKDWGKDSNRIVIDEVVGMCVSLLFIPINLLYVSIAFVLFRFFDIAKPFYIRRTEKIPYGWGVMLDDVLAGIYSNVLLQLFIYLYTTA